ncbi:MAG: sensor histidine kinase [Anaerolineae bacterium]|nr:MAG: sensor histidine kinase [Anaerolineae bacterium]
MARRLSSNTDRSNHIDLEAGLPFYLILYLVMVGAYVAALVYEPSLREPARLVLFTALMLAHAGLHWFGPHLAVSARQANRWGWMLAYFVVQGALVFAIGRLTQLQGLIMGLYFALVGESAGAFWPELRAITLAAAFYIGLMTLNIVMLWGWQTLAQISPMLAGMAVFVIVYVLLYVRQVEARKRAQEMVQELEIAHRRLQEYAAQVKELTVSQERQRMARELHDTLAQGLAGLILQLEAADSHLENSNPARAQAVVQQAMERARTTLHEARRAIQALRPAELEQGNLIDALGQVIDQFAAQAGVRMTFDVNAGPLVVPPDVAQDVLRIVQESLTNVGRHAQASHVRVRLARQGEGLQIVIEDDGLGFDPAEASTQPGCFGLAGMQERAQRLGGELRVESERGQGTRVVLAVEGGEERKGREGRK